LTIQDIEEEFPHKEVKNILKWMKEEKLIEINRKKGTITID
jgi:hypothetical protein